MSKMGEKFTEQQAREYEDRGANRSEELADLLTIAEMTDIIAALSLSFTWLDGDPSGAAVLAIRSVMWEARAERLRRLRNDRTPATIVWTTRRWCGCE
jgi:hypothetical protein